MNKFSIMTANDSIREKVYAEIYYNNDQWAEISQEEDEPVVRFFSPSNGAFWEFPLEEALAILEKVKNKLLN